jgi:hypothetical protein
MEIYRVALLSYGASIRLFYFSPISLNRIDLKLELKSWLEV